MDNVVSLKLYRGTLVLGLSVLSINIPTIECCLELKRLVFVPSAKSLFLFGISVAGLSCNVIE